MYLKSSLRSQVTSPNQVLSLPKHVSSKVQVYWDKSNSSLKSFVSCQSQVFQSNSKSSLNLFEASLKSEHISNKASSYLRHARFKKQLIRHMSKSSLKYVSSHFREFQLKSCHLKQVQVESQVIHIRDKQGLNFVPKLLLTCLYLACLSWIPSLPSIDTPYWPWSHCCVLMLGDEEWAGCSVCLDLTHMTCVYLLLPL